MSNKNKDKNKDIMSVAGILGGLALLSMNSKATQTYVSNPPPPSNVPPPPSPPIPPPPPPSPPPASVTLRIIDKTTIREDESTNVDVAIDSYPYDTSQGLDVYLLYYNTNIQVAWCGAHLPPALVKIPMSVGFTIPELVFWWPILDQYHQYFVSVPIGTSTIIAQVSGYKQPAVYSNTVDITRTANGYLYDAHLLDAYRNENGNIVLTVDINADPNTYMIGGIRYNFPGYPGGLAMTYRFIGGGTYTIVGPVPYEVYEKLESVYVDVNHPGDKAITTESLKV